MFTWIQQPNYRYYPPGKEEGEYHLNVADIYRGVVKFKNDSVSGAYHWSASYFAGSAASSHTSIPNAGRDEHMDWVEHFITNALASINITLPPGRTIKHLKDQP